MRLLVVDHADELGGAQLAILQTVEHLRRYEVEALVGGGPYGRALERCGARVTVLAVGDLLRGARRDARPGLRSVLAVAAASRQVAERLRGHARGDTVVYVNSPKALLLLAPLLLLVRPAAVFHARDVLDVRWVRSGVVRRALHQALKLVDVVVANGTAAAAALPVSCVVVPSPVAADVYEDVVPPPSGAPVVVMAGRLDPWKGQDLFLEALSALRARRPDVTALVVGGPLFGRESYERHLHTLADELGLGTVVTFTGHVPSIRPYLDRAHVSVVATRGAEPFGQVVVQSLARGRVVVAPRAGGPAEMVEPGVTGVLYRPEDAACLADALEQALHMVSDETTRSTRAASLRFEPTRALAQLDDCLTAASRQARAGGWARSTGRATRASRRTDTML